MAGIPYKICEVRLTSSFRWQHHCSVAGLIAAAWLHLPTHRVLSAFPGSNAPFRITERKGFYYRHF
jgi:hypothetical protein